MAPVLEAIPDGSCDEAPDGPGVGTIFGDAVRRRVGRIRRRRQNRRPRSCPRGCEGVVCGGRGVVGCGRDTGGGRW